MVAYYCSSSSSIKLSEMQRSRAAAAPAAPAAEGMLLRREKELVAQLHELLFPSPAPAPSGGGASWSSSSGLNVAEHLFGESSPSSPVKATTAAPCRRRRGRKRAREDDEQDKDKHGAGAEARCGNKTRRKKKQGTRMLVTTVPDFDGYEWRKYGQKQIEAAKYTRSYYRCTNSADQGCPAKRTVQRNDDDNSGGPPKYTVVYISEHTCKVTESAPPVILETTVRCNKNPAADHDAAAAAAAAHVTLSSPDVAAAVDVPAESANTTATTGTVSPAISDITWSGGGDANPSELGDYSHVFAADDWDMKTTTAQAAIALLQEMDFAGPIRSPVHDVPADCLIDDLFFDEPISTIPSSSSISSYHFFGF